MGFRLNAVFGSAVEWELKQAILAAALERWPFVRLPREFFIRGREVRERSVPRAAGDCRPGRGPAGCGAGVIADRAPSGNALKRKAGSHGDTEAQRRARPATPLCETGLILKIKNQNE